MNTLVTLMKNLLFSLAVIIGLTTLEENLRSDVLFDSTYSYGSASSGMGYDFKVGGTALQVTQLGIPWYAGKAGNTDAEIYLKTIGGSILASTNINVDGVTSDYVWANISPVTLQPNTEYQLFSQPLRGGYIGGSAIIYNPSISTSLVSLVYSAEYGNGPFYEVVGPNMRFFAIPASTPSTQTGGISSPEIPEPSTIAFLGLGLVTLIIFYHRASWKWV